MLPVNIFANMKNLISGFLLLLLAVTAWQYFSFHKKSKTLTVVKKESGLQKITVLDIINPSLTANENAFIDEQALHRLINDKSDQSVTPTSCGNWWNFTENNKSSCIQLSYHPNRVGNTPGPISFDFEFDGIYKLKKINSFALNTFNPKYLSLFVIKIPREF